MGASEQKQPSKFILLFRITREMRKHQKGFFSTKSQSDLIASKEYEKEADKLIKEIETEAKERGVEL